MDNSGLASIGFTFVGIQDINPYLQAASLLIGISIGLHYWYKVIKNK